MLTYCYICVVYESCWKSRKWRIKLLFFNLLRGFWCYWDVSYHFGKDLTRQTEWVEQNFDLGPRWGAAGVQRWGLEGVIFFGRILQFCIKQTAPEIEFKRCNAECDVVVGCILFGMNFSQPKMHFYFFIIWQNFEPALQIVLWGIFSLFQMAKYWKNNLSIRSYWPDRAWEFRGLRWNSGSTFCHLCSCRRSSWECLRQKGKVLLDQIRKVIKRPSERLL